MAVDWTTVGTLVAAFCAAAGVIWPMRRAQRTDLRKFIQESITQQVAVAKTHSDEAISAVREQVRAFELEIAKKEYVTRTEIREEMSNLASRLEKGINEVKSEVAELNRFLRERPFEGAR